MFEASVGCGEGRTASSIQREEHFYLRFMAMRFPLVTASYAGYVVLSIEEYEAPLEETLGLSALRVPNKKGQI